MKGSRKSNRLLNLRSIYGDLNINKIFRPFILCELSKRNLKKGMFYIFLTLSCLFSFNVYAEPGCPSWWYKPDQPIHKGIYGVHPDDTIEIVNRDIKYRIPIGYFSFWHLRDAKEKLKRYQALESWPGIGFNFWMPSLRYVERNMPYTPNAQPCESGRQPPKPHQHVVQMVFNKRFETRNGEKLTPQIRFERLIRRVWIGVYRLEENEEISDLKHYGINENKTKFGLIKYDRGHTTEIYRHPEGSNEQIYFDCTSISTGLPNPLCRGYIYDESIDEHIYLEFRSNFIADWQNILASAKSLLEQWRVDLPKENEVSKANQKSDIEVSDER